MTERAGSLALRSSFTGSGKTEADVYAEADKWIAKYARASQPAATEERGDG